MHSCNESDLFAQTIHFQEWLGNENWALEHGFCLDDSNKISVSGNYDTKHRSYVTFDILPCEASNCLPLPYIEEQIE